MVKELPPDSQHHSELRVVGIAGAVDGHADVTRTRERRAAGAVAGSADTWGNGARWTLIGLVEFYMMFVF